jgi:hypothetical protein
MKLFRRGAVATAAALAISGTAVLTSIAPAAQAVSVTGHHGYVIVDLTSTETKVTAAQGLASAYCTFEILPRIGGHVPLSLGECTTAVHQCSVAAGQRAHQVAQVTFYHGRSTCSTR